MTELLQAEPVRAVRAALGEGGLAWLVGGAVRDARTARTGSACSSSVMPRAGAAPAGSARR